MPITEEKKLYITDLMRKMKSKKDKIFGHRIEIFDYYIYGEIFDKNGADALGKHLPETHIYNFNTKSDDTAKSIIETSQGMYVAALLPRGVYSISISDDSTPDSQNKQQQLSDLSEKLRNFLDQPELSFNHSFFASVGDYLNYGNCLIRVLENGKCVYIPFKSVWFYSEYLSGQKILMYRVRYLPESLIPMLNILGQGEDGSKLLAEAFQRDVTESDKQTMKQTMHIMSHKEYVELFHVFITNPENGMIEEYLSDEESGIVHHLKSYNNESFPLFFAREIKQDQTYGFGSGISATSNIYNANVFNNICMLEGKKVAFPTTLLPSDSALNQESEGKKDLNKFVSMPGFSNIDYSPITSQQKVQVFPGSPQAVQITREAQQQCLVQIEKSYNVDIFQLAAESPRTATEIIERKNVAIRVFTGKSSPFYNELLYPLLNFILNKFVISSYMAELEKNQIPLAFKNPKVKIESFASEQRKQVDLLELQNVLQLTTGLPEPVLAGLMEEGFYQPIVEKMKKLLTV